jgi:nucleotide-binding universal stress UspA family protein
MNKILMAVDDTKGSIKAAETLAEWAGMVKPDTIILLHVEQMLGRSLIGEGLESEMDLEEIRDALEGTEYKDQLDKRAGNILAYHTQILVGAGFTGIKPMIKQGHPAEVILATANEENVDLIVVGSRGKRRHDFLIGSVSREVANGAKTPVLLVH